MKFAWDSTVGNIEVTPHQITVSFQVSNADLNSGLRMENLVEINAKKFASAVMAAALAPVTTANFPVALTSAAAAFGFGDLATLQASLKKSSEKNLILDGAYLARVANSPGFFQSAGNVGGPTNGWKAFGWDLITQNTDWTGADPNVVGFACNPQAIAAAIGLPVETPIPGNILERKDITLDNLDIQIAAYAWFNTSTRTLWASYDCVAGFALGDDRRIHSGERLSFNLRGLGSAHCRTQRPAGVHASGADF